MKYALGVFLLFFGTLSASGINLGQKGPGQQPPLVKEEARDIFGYAEASYIYWIARRDSVGGFISNIYYPATADPKQGTVVYAPHSAQSGFKVAAGLRFVEREMELLLRYTWFNNNHPGTGVYSYPGGQAYVPIDPSLTTTTGGTIQWKNEYQKIVLEFVNILPTFQYLSQRPYFMLVSAWDHEVTKLFSENGNGKNPSTTTLDQTWWSIGPELGLRFGYFIYKGKKNQLSIISMNGAAQTWGPTKSTLLEIENSTGDTVLSSQESVSTISTLVDMEIGLAYSYRDLERNTSSVEFRVNWELQTWVNNYSAFNESLLILQGLTMTLVCVF